MRHRLGLHFKQLLSAGNNGVVSLLIASRRFEAQALRATVLHGDIDALNLVFGSESSPVRSWLARTQQLDKRLLRTLLITPNVKVFEAMILELSSTLLATFDTELLNDLVLRAVNNGWPNMVAHLIERGAQINELIGFAQAKLLGDLAKQATKKLYRSCSTSARRFAVPNSGRQPSMDIHRQSGL